MTWRKLQYTSTIDSHRHELRKSFHHPRLFFISASLMTSSGSRILFAAPLIDEGRSFIAGLAETGRSGSPDIRESREGVVDFGEEAV